MTHRFALWMDRFGERSVVVAIAILAFALQLVTMRAPEIYGEPYLVAKNILAGKGFVFAYPLCKEAVTCYVTPLYVFVQVPILWLGLGVIAFFIVLRYINKYGDPDPWSTQRNAGVTFLSFMNVHKYPPSLLYMCATVGIGILFLALVGHKKNWLTRFITVYGRVPFLYYVLHFFLIHFISAICFLARGHSYAEGLKMHPEVMPAKFIAAGEGYSLFAVYIIWICIVVSL